MKETILILLRITVIFILQLSGALMISAGLQMIWMPLSPIFNGLVLIYVGRGLYLELESEERRK